MMQHNAQNRCTSVKNGNISCEQCIYWISNSDLFELGVCTLNNEMIERISFCNNYVERVLEGEINIEGNR